MPPCGSKVRSLTIPISRRISIRISSSREYPFVSSNGSHSVTGCRSAHLAPGFPSP
jgi:hypothetical protein